MGGKRIIIWKISQPHITEIQFSCLRSPCLFNFSFCFPVCLISCHSSFCN